MNRPSASLVIASGPLFSDQPASSGAATGSGAGAPRGQRMNLFRPSSASQIVPFSGSIVAASTSREALKPLLRNFSLAIRTGPPLPGAGMSSLTPVSLKAVNCPAAGLTSAEKPVKSEFALVRCHAPVSRSGPDCCRLGSASAVAVTD